jgi:hypothetical protein
MGPTRKNTFISSGSPPHVQNHRWRVLRHLFPAIVSSALHLHLHLQLRWLGRPLPQVGYRRPGYGRVSVGHASSERRVGGCWAGGLPAGERRAGGRWAVWLWVSVGRVSGGRALGGCWVDEHRSSGSHIGRSGLVEDTLRRENTMIWRVSACTASFVGEFGEK